MIDYTLHTLDNGLRIAWHYDPSSSHVVLNTLYNVGARDEEPSLTGMAHLFEHLMFGGSSDVPDFDAAVEGAGGTDNAWTSNDFTNFYTVVTTPNAETAFWVESDRMLSLLFSPESLEVQRKVVIEEFRQTHLNRPYGDFGHRLRELLYEVHPYRYPTIGKEIEHIERVTMDDVKKFFFSHYAPNNAVVAVAGPISEELTLRLAEKYYATIPSRPIAPRNYGAEPAISTPRRKEIRTDVPHTRICIAMHMAPASDPDYRVADIITDILASGKSARFNRELVLGTDIFTGADAMISGSEDPGFIMFMGSLRSDTDEAIAGAEQLIRGQLRRLCDEEVTPEELERALNRFESKLTFSRIDCRAKASDLARAIMTGRDINKEIELYRDISPADVQRVARALFLPDRSATLIYRPR